jgi:hypothetical protein
MMEEGFSSVGDGEDYANKSWSSAATGRRIVQVCQLCDQRRIVMLGMKRTSTFILSATLGIQIDI